MNILNSKTIILFQKELANSKVFTCLTKNFGLITALAFGSNSTSKRFKGSLDYFKILDLEFICNLKNETASYQINNVKKVEHSFPCFSKDLNKFYLVSYINELISVLVHNGEIFSKSEKNFFEILEKNYYHIEKFESNTKEYALKFTLKIFKETGFLPNDYKLNKQSNLKQFVKTIIDKEPKSLNYLV